ncbi:MAG: Crp/Fnr family transcriptional regulator [Nitrospirae bacterium]|nr:Crp/Fnr family transcriptional regulator [Nitrospirota bacterium]MBF0591625.1 Crp/Fnr family transcriptional regulator [Nitrospirota bacterium]
MQKCSHEGKFVELRKVRLFHNLTDSELTSILNYVDIKNFKKGEMVIYPEDTNEIFYSLIRGKVKMVRSDENGKEIIFAIHQSGDSFGEISVIDGKECPASAMAMEPSRVALIERDNFHTIISSQKNVLDNLLQFFCVRLRDMWNTCEMLSFDNSARRIMMFFLVNVDKYGTTTDTGITINMKFTHQDIADITGITRETVSRVIGEWRKNGDISILSNKSIHFNINFLHKF